MAKSNRTPNDQRSTVKNPISYEFKIDKQNRANQEKGRSIAGHSEYEPVFLKDGELYLRGIFI